MSATLSPGEALMLIEILNAVKGRCQDHDLVRASQYLEEAIASIPSMEGDEP